MVSLHKLTLAEDREMAAVLEGVKLRWDLSTEEILKRTDELIERSRKVYDAVGALKAEELTYENCLKVKSIACVVRLTFHAVFTCRGLWLIFWRDFAAHAKVCNDMWFFCSSFAKRLVL